MSLDELKPKAGSRKPRRRVGRGIGSGNGKTAGRGTKGAGARAGRKRRDWYEGGSLPLQMRLPKFGFNSRSRVEIQTVNIGALAGFDAGTLVDAEALASAGLVRRPDRPVKILGQGELESKLELRVHAISQSARSKVEAAGGTVELVETGRRPPGRGRAG